MFTGGAEASGGDVLTLNQLIRLGNHQYKAEGVSMLEPFMQPFWRWLVEQIPLWCAPNALTLLGLILNAATTLVIILYCPSFVGEVCLYYFVIGYLTIY